MLTKWWWLWCATAMFGGRGLVCYTLEVSVRTTYYQYVIETCRGTNNNIIIRIYHTNLDEETVI